MTRSQRHQPPPPWPDLVLAPLMMTGHLERVDGTLSFRIPRVHLRNHFAGADQPGLFLTGTLAVTPRHMTFSYDVDIPRQLRLHRGDVVGLIMTWHAIFSRRCYLSFYTATSRYSFRFPGRGDQDFALQLWTTAYARWEQ